MMQYRIPSDREICEADPVRLAENIRQAGEQIRTLQKAIEQQQQLIEMLQKILERQKELKQG